MGLQQGSSRDGYWFIASANKLIILSWNKTANSL